MGGLEDVAQALHDAPLILPKLRVYWIGGPNKKWGPDACQYLIEHHPELWIIEANSTYRGWFTGGNQTGAWANCTFVERHVAGQGALGDCYVQAKDDLKMGDTPSVAWVLKGLPHDPAQPGWGGKFVRTWGARNWRLDRLPTPDDRMEVFGILELVLPLGDKVPPEPEAVLVVDNQRLSGTAPGDGTMRLRFSPKAPQTFDFKIESNVAALNGQTGGITAYEPAADMARQPAAQSPSWWTDDPSPAVAEGSHHGSKTVSRHREAFLRDFAARMRRCATPRQAVER